MSDISDITETYSEKLKMAALLPQPPNTQQLLALGVQLSLQFSQIKNRRERCLNLLLHKLLV